MRQIITIETTKIFVMSIYSWFLYFLTFLTFFLLITFYIFLKCRKWQNGLELLRKKVVMDVPNRWNLTYIMLETVIQFQVVFLRLHVIDPLYISMPGEEEWTIAKSLRDCLSLFYEVTQVFSTTLHLTSNQYFPLICKIHLKLT